MVEGTEIELIAERSNGHYLVMFIGWRGEVQVYGSLIHIDIKGNQIWIQLDGTQEGIAQQLVEAGVPQSDKPGLSAFTNYLGLLYQVDKGRSEGHFSNRPFRKFEKQ